MGMVVMLYDIKDSLKPCPLSIFIKVTGLLGRKLGGISEVQRKFSKGLMTRVDINTDFLKYRYSLLMRTINNFYK